MLDQGKEWGFGSDFDTGDAGGIAGKPPQDFAKFFSGRCYMACGAGDADEVKR